MKECRTGSLASVDKALEIFELIATSEESQNPASLSRHTGMSPARTIGVLQLLSERGFVEQGKGHGQYTIGVRGIMLSQAIINNLSILKYAKPIMQSLEKQHDEAIYVAVLKETDVFFLDMVDTEQTIKATKLIGQSFPFFSNAAGKVIMAFEPRDYLQRYLVKLGRKQPLVDVAHFQEEMQSIRDKGVAVDIGGLGDNVTSVAVAIKDYAGKVLGALTLIAPSFRILGERLEKEIIPSMVENAQLLSSRFGYAAI